MHFYPGLTPDRILEMPVEQYRGYISQINEVVALFIPEAITKDDLRDELDQAKHARVRMPKRI